MTGNLLMIHFFQKLTYNRFYIPGLSQLDEAVLGRRQAGRRPVDLWRETWRMFRAFGSQRSRKNIHLQNADR
jgi:hypothetical protein